MTTIKFPPHNQAIPITYKLAGKNQVILLEPSSYDFTFELPEHAQLFGEFGLCPKQSI